MKKNTYWKLGLSLVTMLAISAGLVACGQKQGAEDSNPKEAEASADKEIVAGFCAGPYADMFKETIEPSLIEKGYTVKSVEFSDYVQPNKSLADGEIDVNMFQHSVYLKNFSEEHGLDLVYLKEVPTAGMGIFSEKYTSLEDVEEGATVAIPNDPTNLSRAIRVLEQTGLIKIDPAADPTQATQNTLSENLKNLKFVEVEAPQLPRSLDSAEIAIINGNYAIGAGLNLSDALYNEEIADGYVNVIAVRAEDQDAQFAKDIVEIVESDAFKKVIEDPNKQYAAFHKPADY